MDRIKVLFVCVHNSSRSQMAEAFLNKFGGDIFEACSAGLEPGALNPLAVTAMTNIGIDISGKSTKGVLEYFKAGRRFDYVITVCDKSSGEQCPIFPGICKRLHWGIPDPTVCEGPYKEKMLKTKQVRDAIEVKVKGFIKDIVGHDGFDSEKELCSVS